MIELNKITDAGMLLDPAADLCRLQSMSALRSPRSKRLIRCLEQRIHTYVAGFKHMYNANLFNPLSV